MSSDVPNSEWQRMGTAFVVLGALTHATVSLVIKENPFPLLLTTQIRWAVATAISAPLFLTYRASLHLKFCGPGGAPFWPVLKGSVVFLYILLWWLAVRDAPLGDCTAVMQTTPILLTPVVTRLVLGESWPRYLVIRAPLAIVGLALVVDPPCIHYWTGSLDSSAAIASRAPANYRNLLLAAAMSPALPLATHMTRGRNWIEVECVGSCVNCMFWNPLFISLSVLLVENPSPASSYDPATGLKVALIIVASMAAFLALALDTIGYQMAEPGKASMFRCLEVPYSFMLQRVGSGQIVLWREVAGTCLILLALGIGWVAEAHPREPDFEP
uniref:EamA domain-containing protein n=1 Tax=Zooxanthella nutricula TaxID=1333877 RepID=A0A6U6KMX1_9DINO|mmetsp:Transcript_27982/g.84374  ORF Transcript_27982/g.84374 Transcript_27982/m.84374 type:complete len:328 (+) Transcript_27982:93-1076(+)